MNIFALDKDPKRAAAAVCDQHVCKMIVESAKILSAVLKAYGETSNDLPLPAPADDPAVEWAKTGFSNYFWLLEHFKSLLEQYEQRWHRKHKYGAYYGTLSRASRHIPKGRLTPFAQIMPEQYRGDDPVEAYRNYYRAEKRFAEWRHTPAPSWWS